MLSICLSIHLSIHPSIHSFIRLFSLLISMYCNAVHMPSQRCHARRHARSPSESCASLFLLILSALTALSCVLLLFDAAGVC
ncbi:hypothetical protein GQ42DRAFT_71924 [Ramicandelaber brevisporus]|nr:hypothetical protein GQ42DRAFT_71924 [Ramicandelaber brevisporus]